MSADQPNGTGVRAEGFYRYAQALPDRDAVIAPDGSSTKYGELASTVNRVSHALRASGLGVGDRVALLVGNTPRYFEVMLGAGQVGVQVVPVNTHLTADEVAYIIDDSDSGTVFAEGSLLPIAAGAVEALGRPAADIAAIDVPDPGPHRAYEAFLAGMPDSEPADRVYAQAMLYTSGTTGRPKGVSWPITATVVPEAAVTGADAIMALRGMRHDSTAISLVSGQLASHAGAATPVEVKRRMIDWWGPVLWEYYACSEGWGTSISPHDWLEHPGSVGRHDGNGATMKILDEDGDELPPGEIGMLWIRNPNGVVTSYLHDPEKTAANRRGEFYTAGDMAYIDAGGWLYIADRRTDLILSGAVNIYPAEVEDALRKHPAVADVAVVGAPDPEWGQRVHAVVVPSEDADPGRGLAEEIRRFATETLARFKVPREIEFRASLPYSPTGKLLRRELRAEFTDA